MVVFPPCKINLGLQVVARRTDGYHDLITCFYPVPWCDILEIIPSDTFSFTATGIPIPPGDKQNLCVLAYELLKKDFNLSPVAIHLHKIIPMGAGLGGGSSDAAYTLIALNEIFHLELSNDALAKYASQLGSDCAFFTQTQPKLGKGRGEILEDINTNLKGKFLVIVKPDVHVSTAEAYSGVRPALPEIDLREVLEKDSVDKWTGVITNDFEKSVFEKYPVISGVKKSLYEAGAAFAGMSGSGSAVFGIFASQPSLKDKFPGMLYWSGCLNR